VPATSTSVNRTSARGPDGTVPAGQKGGRISSKTTRSTSNTERLLSVPRNARAPSRSDASLHRLRKGFTPAQGPSIVTRSVDRVCLRAGGRLESSGSPPRRVAAPRTPVLRPAPTRLPLPAEGVPNGAEPHARRPHPGRRLAGLRAAVELSHRTRARDIGIVSKVQLMRAHSVCAEGGTAAVLHEDEATASSCTRGTA